MISLKDEIKEILDYLGDDENYNRDCNDGSYYLELPYREARELKDCITNLQEENKRLKHKLEQMYNDTKDTYNEICAEQVDYKSRNEKAIDYCKLNKEFTPRLEDVENILQGENNDRRNME